MINYKHLYYFQTVATNGTVARAAEQLHVTAQAISMQLQVLEAQLGEALFQKRGRGLELTEAGKTVLRYTTQIFDMGNELEQAMRRGAFAAETLRIGICDMIAKTMIFRDRIGVQAWAWWTRTGKARRPGRTGRSSSPCLAVGKMCDVSAASAAVPPAVPVSAMVVAAVTAVGMVMVVVAEAKVQRHGRADIHRIAVAGVIRIVGGVRRHIHAAPESSSEQECGDDPPRPAFDLRIHVSPF